MRGRGRQDGLTLLEIMVTLGVVGLMTVALAVGYKRLPSTALRRDAGKLAAAVRSTFDRATATGAHHRMIVDLDNQTYRIERCEGKIEMRRAASVKEEAEAKKDEEEKKAAEPQAEQMTPEQAMQAEMMSGVPAAGQMLGGAGGKSGVKCGAVKGELGQPVKLNAHPQVTLNKVWVGHLETASSAGMVTINFFPQGYAERAVFELTAGEDDVLSIALSPMTGRVQVVSGPWRGAEDFVSRDAEGKAVAPQ